MSCIYLMLHPVKKELCKEKCGFDHEPADDFVKSQWQSRTKSVTYLIYRWVIALFFTAVVIESMIDSEDSASFWLYFIYMTNWGIIMCMLTNLLGAVLVTAWHYHPEYSDKLININSLTSPFRIFWAMHIITLVLSIVITIIYWSILYNAAESILNATNVLTHAFNSICMLIDLLIVAHPLRLLHMFLPVLFGTVYAVFSVVYQKLGGVNKRGNPYIYHVIDWRQPVSASLTVVGVLLLTCFVYMILFTLYKLRTLAYRRINKSCFILPYTTEAVVEGSEKSVLPHPPNNSNGIQHSPSGISMVFGHYTGYYNKGFASTGECVSNY